MRAKLQEIKAELRRRMHQPIPVQGRWLRQVVTGHFALLCGPYEWPGALGVPVLRDRPLAANASAAQPEGRLTLGSYDEARRRLAPQAAYPSSLAQQRFAVKHPR